MLLRGDELDHREQPRGEQRRRCERRNPGGVSGIEAPAGGLGPVITWTSFSNAHHAVYGASNLVDGYTILLHDDLSATPPADVYTDTRAGATFLGYRIEYKP